MSINISLCRFKSDNLKRQQVISDAEMMMQKRTKLYDSLLLLHTVFSKTFLPEVWFFVMPGHLFARKDFDEGNKLKAITKVSSQVFDDLVTLL